MLSRRRLLATGAAVSLAGSARAQSARPLIKIDGLNDQSGRLRDLTDPSSVACFRQAVREFSSSGFDVEVIWADHQNKPDVSTAAE